MPYSKCVSNFLPRRSFFDDFMDPRNSKLLLDTIRTMKDPHATDFMILGSAGRLARAMGEDLPGLMEINARRDIDEGEED